MSERVSESGKKQSGGKKEGKKQPPGLLAQKTKQRASVMKEQRGRERQRLPGAKEFMVGLSSFAASWLLKGAGGGVPVKATGSQGEATDCRCLYWSGLAG